MADLARSAVVFNAEWSEGRNKRVFVRDMTLTLSGQGGNTNKIPASVLGFSKVLYVRKATKSDNGTTYVAHPSVDGSRILLGTTPADVTATVNMIVAGEA